MGQRRISALVAVGVIIAATGGCRVAGGLPAEATGPSGSPPAATAPSTTGPAAATPATPGPATPGPATTAPGMTGPDATTPATPGPVATGPGGAVLADLAADTDGLRLARPVNGIRHGELAVTIRNNGPVPVGNVHFSVEVPESMIRGTGDWTGCGDLVSHRAGFPAGAICQKGDLAPGETAVFRLGMTSPAAKDGADSRISRWLIDVWAGGPGGERTPDARPEDNRRIFSVHRE